MRNITIELAPLEVIHLAYALRTTVQELKELCSSYKESTGEELAHHTRLAVELQTLAQRLEDMASSSYMDS